jgi:hypothetical protein
LYLRIIEKRSKLEKNITHIHRGAILHGVAKRHPNTISKIANDAGYDQSTFYLHKNNADLSLDILIKYANAMGHDFSNEIPGYKDYLMKNGLKRSNDKKLTYEELEKDRDEYRDKYYSQLEENHRLLKEMYKK